MPSVILQLEKVPAWGEILSFNSIDQAPCVAEPNCFGIEMSHSVSDVSDDFEFIDTPAAPTPIPPPEAYGVRTTTVSCLPGH